MLLKLLLDTKRPISAIAYEMGRSENSILIQAVKILRLEVAKSNRTPQTQLQPRQTQQFTPPRQFNPMAELPNYGQIQQWQTNPEMVQQRMGNSVPVMAAQQPPAQPLAGNFPGIYAVQLGQLRDMGFYNS